MARYTLIALSVLLGFAVCATAVPVVPGAKAMEEKLHNIFQEWKSKVGA
jgi:hypothetical protein